MPNTDSVEIRAFQLEDKVILAQLANNKNVWDNLRNRMPHPYSEQDAENFIQMALQAELPSIFAITYNGELCGGIGLHLQDDVYTNTAELGYWLGEPYWRKGIISQAIPLILAHGFKTLQLRRIFAGVFEYNAGSIRALEKAGFKKEGCLKQAVIKNGKVWDEHRYGFLNSDFE